MLHDDIVTFDKAYLIEKLKGIAALGWIPNARHGNHGGVGNTLEDLLGIRENNLPIPNAAEWELKAQRRSRAKSHTTLVHMEPSPRAIKFVPKVLLPKYGWPHSKAGKEYPADEMSFRQTISGKARSDRGFMVVIDREARKLIISFDHRAVDDRHKEWLASVEHRIGLGELDPQPYWGFDDIEHAIGVKLLNCFYVLADVRKEDERELYRYSSVRMLQKFSFEKFLLALEAGTVYVDFDARTHHNHGTKFRMRHDDLPLFYETVAVIV